MARQYLGSGDADEICPAANGGGFVLLHEPNQFHEVDDKYDRLLADEPNDRTSKVRSLDRCGLLLSVFRPIVGHIDDPARRSRCRHPRW